ncbi:hypothetical protein G6F37_012295 [Rhizopus arrhizus]|nr:hypothetical protein G6F37_012295 [Rhizopus arrhizus]
MTRSISQDTQNDLRVLLESDLSYEDIANRLTLSKATVHRYCKKWNIQRPDNTGGRPQILTEASKSLMKRMVDLQYHPKRLKEPRIQSPTKKKGTSFVSKTQESTLGMGTCSQVLDY